MFDSSLLPVVCIRSHVLCRMSYPMFPVSLDCPYFIAPSVFSNVYIALNINPSTIRIKYHNIYRSVEMSIVITRKSQEKLMVIYNLSVHIYLYISVLS